MRYQNPEIAEDRSPDPEKIIAMAAQRDPLGPIVGPKEDQIIIPNRDCRIEEILGRPPVDAEVDDSAWEGESAFHPSKIAFPQSEARFVEMIAEIGEGIPYGHDGLFSHENHYAMGPRKSIHIRAKS